MVLLIVVLALLTPAGATAQLVMGADTTRISVTATAEILRAPDRVVVFVEIAANDESGQLAALANGQTRNDFASQNRLFSTAFSGRGVQLVPSNVAVRVTVQASWIFISG